MFHVEGTLQWIIIIITCKSGSLQVVFLIKQDLCSWSWKFHFMALSITTLTVCIPTSTPALATHFESEYDTKAQYNLSWPSQLYYILLNTLQQCSSKGTELHPGEQTQEATAGGTHQLLPSVFKAPAPIWLCLSELCPGKHSQLKCFLCPVLVEGEIIHLGVSGCEGFLWTCCWRRFNAAVGEHPCSLARVLCSPGTRSPFPGHHSSALQSQPLCDPATSPSQGEPDVGKQFSPQNSFQGAHKSQQVHPSQHCCHPTHPQEDKNLGCISNPHSPCSAASPECQMQQHPLGCRIPGCWRLCWWDTELQKSPDHHTQLPGHTIYLIL